jgi:hypothetical protein
MNSQATGIQFNRAKFIALLLYICATADPHRLGAVKLNKVLYFADMIWYALTGMPITGAGYRKRPNGPTTDNVLPALRELQRSGAIEIEEIDYYGYRKKVYRATEAPDKSHFADEEISLIDDVIQFVCYNNTAKTISEFSHNRAWEMAEFGAEIPYHTAFALFPSEVSEETIEWAVSVAQEIEAERSKRPDLDYPSFADFRSRIQTHRS